ncbi:PQQ-dependent sugar dehydrogenase [Thiomicrorhabdus sp.]|uniref:PQQ-dependent sugar dehydrogenase n=1 Tax=Thiomicrorhabdus sp. TaxID=2039724 RepID=UPI0029C980C6|nr:PQQ-dependent sugar dehydrogenase [Thiomicrorhabdus sp.]
MLRLLWHFALLASVLSASVSADEATPVRLEKVAENLGIVWAMDFVDRDRIVFTVRDGKAGLLNLRSGPARLTWLQGLPEVQDQGQGGLLDVAVPPDFSESGWLYFTYSKPGLVQARTTLARARLKDDALVDWQDLLVSDSASLRNIHFGSRIAFDGKGHVFFSVGDRGLRAPAQDLTNHIGTIIRLNMDGSVPQDNPFVGVSGALDEIWSYGHRNPQGLVYDAVTDRLWEIEHGPRGGDEINLIEKGKNYGWPLVSQGQEYFADIDVGVKHKPGMQEPRKVYIPSIAPSDLLLYRGREFPDWQESLLTGALKLRHLNRIEVDEKGYAHSEQRYLVDLQQRVRSLAADEFGRLYLGMDSGLIYRLVGKLSQ